MQIVTGCKRRVAAMAAALIMGMVTAAAVADDSEREAEQDMVIFKTNYGDITLELYPEDAPVTVENFLQYVDDGFYDGTIFHRVIPGFVIQGGGLDEDMQRLETRAPIENEADNGLKNERGMLSMARTQDVNSATSQFFINLADNAFLDHGVRDFGYAVFARVVDGMDVVDRIAEVPTGRQAGQADVPSETIRVEEARRK
ncbi:peptidylprolyl isomerase [Aquisalimonas sp.]|uniref:peptidylprolyl isomerase n=1 Tax=unclassified Aquisalimonas TaxID=2644645 RepID=UPI0025C18D36|nr:peptidylprolyl isomerase [Aquisalimonas sp.]